MRFNHSNESARRPTLEVHSGFLSEQHCCYCQTTRAQALVCHCPFELLNGVRLSNWKDLKELRIQSESLYEYAEDEPEFDEFRSSLVNVMRHRTESKREELRLYLEDVLLVDVEQLTGCFRSPYVDYNLVPDHRTTNGDLFFFKNYRLIRRDFYPFVFYVNFNELMELNVELSSDFFDRFS